MSPSELRWLVVLSWMMCAIIAPLLWWSRRLMRRWIPIQDKAEKAWSVPELRRALTKDQEALVSDLLRLDRPYPEVKAAIVAASAPSAIATFLVFLLLLFALGLAVTATNQYARLP